MNQSKYHDEITKIVTESINKLQGSQDQFELIKSFGDSYIIESGKYKGCIDLSEGISLYDLVGGEKNHVYRKGIKKPLVAKLKEYLNQEIYEGLTHKDYAPKLTTKKLLRKTLQHMHNEQQSLDMVI